jgi:hypothetical protein
METSNLTCLGLPTALLYAFLRPSAEEIMYKSKIKRKCAMLSNALSDQNCMLFRMVHLDFLLVAG